MTQKPLRYEPPSRNAMFHNPINAQIRFLVEQANEQMGCPAGCCGDSCSLVDASEEAGLVWTPFGQHEFLGPIGMLGPACKDSAAYRCPSCKAFLGIQGPRPFGHRQWYLIATNEHFQQWLIDGGGR